MERAIKIFLIGFVIVTGTIAGIGLLLMDSTLQDLLNPVGLLAAPKMDILDDGVEMKIRINDESFANGMYLNVPDSEYIVLYCHAGNGNLFHHTEMIRAFTELGLSVFALDYRGFGLADSIEITDETLHEDVAKAYSTLRREKWNSSRVIIYGQGISAGIQGELLKKNQCAAWIMDNPIPSLQDSTDSAIRKLLTVDRLSVYDSLDKLLVPVFICYDPGIVRQDTIDKIKSKGRNVSVCEITGRRTRGEFDSVDWAGWKSCMTDLLESITATGIAPQKIEKPMKKVMAHEKQQPTISR